MVKHINEKNFNEEIKKEGVCLVDFYATWCGPCMMLSPILEKIGNSRSNANILKIDVDNNPNLASQFKIDTIPTMCIFKDGKLQERVVGLRSEEEIIEMIEKYK